MERWKWFCWSRGMVAPRANNLEPEPFSLPCPMPDWPRGGEFAKGAICLGELEVVQITRFERIWSCLSSTEKGNGAIFYKPSSIPEGFFSLGHFCHRRDQPLHGFVLAVRENAAIKHSTGLPALVEPVDYALIWSSDDFSDDDYDCGGSYFWFPIPPEGYRALGIFVTSRPNKPSIEEVRCVRVDLTDSGEAHELMIDLEAIFPHLPCRVWKMRPSSRGLSGTGVLVGTFCCNTDSSSRDKLSVHCLKNLDSSLNSMPNLEQIHALIQHYGPTLMFHPKEVYLPSSVSWFFENGATLHKKDAKAGEIIDVKGSNLPLGGQNDGEYWIDLPDDDDKDSFIKKGNIETAELYVHVKPALGGTFTDIAMWIFCPFNGPATIKLGAVNFPMSKVGQHVGDWEHYTLRISNFNGELWSTYFSQHSGGEWVDASGLEFLEANKAVVYSSKSGHASFPRPGSYLQGSEKLGIGIRNDAARSKFFVDSSSKYQIVAAEYLGDVEEPFWLQYVRKWGPSIKYNSRSEINRILRLLPLSIRNAVENIFNSLPMELYGEEGPTGPKEKNNWVGDERW